MKETPKTSYLASAKNLDELNMLYKALCKKYHPDLGGDLEIMQAINAEYDARLPEMQRRAERGESERDDQGATCTVNPEEFREVLAKLARFDDLVIELCGKWLWISGNTYAARDALKAAGCKWSTKKKMWYFRKEEDAVFNRKGGMHIEDIRRVYGSETVKLHQQRLN